MTKIYKAKKGSFIQRLLILFIILPFIIFFLDQGKYMNRPYLMLPFVTPIILVLWAYFDTFYKIEKERLVYRFSFVRGSIAISEMTDISVNSTLRKGKKPALSSDGVVLKYAKNQKLFVAPQDKEELIKDLLKINPSIRVAR